MTIDGWQWIALGVLASAHLFSALYAICLARMAGRKTPAPDWRQTPERETGYSGGERVRLDRCKRCGTERRIEVE